MPATAPAARADALPSLGAVFIETVELHDVAGSILGAVPRALTAPVTVEVSRADEASVEAAVRRRVALEHPARLTHAALAAVLCRSAAAVAIINARGAGMYRKRAAGTGKSQPKLSERHRGRVSATFCVCLRGFT